MPFAGDSHGAAGLRFRRMTTFQFPFPDTEVEQWAAKYDYPGGDGEAPEIRRSAKANGFLTQDQFLSIAGWKSARPVRRHQANDEETVREVTRFAFSTSNEMLRLRSLTLLSGVADRTASAILHLCHWHAYPMMDERASGALGVKSAPRNWAATWPEYTLACREFANRAKVDLRKLDKALWAYSAQHDLVAK